MKIKEEEAWQRCVVFVLILLAALSGCAAPQHIRPIALDSQAFVRKAFESVKAMHLSEIDELEMLRRCTTFLGVSTVNLGQTTSVEHLAKAMALIGDSKAKAVGCVRAAIEVAELRGVLHGSESLDAFSNNSDGKKMGAIGLSLQKQGADIIIAGVLKDTPAAKAGLRRGDVLLTIDNQTVRGLDLKEAIMRLRGELPSSVALVIQRAEDRSPIHNVIPREVINIPSRAKVEHIDDDFLYVNCGFRYYPSSVEAIALELKMLTAKMTRPPRGVILDLRWCEGGELRSTVALAGIFLPEEKLVLVTEGRAAEANAQLRNTRQVRSSRSQIADPVGKIPLIFKEIPITVLISSSTAAGAELIAAVMREERGAKLIGTRTMGLGYINTLVPIDFQHTLQMPTGFLYTPAGKKIHGNGVEPDIAADSFGADRHLEDLLYNPVDVSKDSLVRIARDELKAFVRRDTK